MREIRVTRWETEDGRVFDTDYYPETDEELTYRDF